MTKCLTPSHHTHIHPIQPQNTTLSSLFTLKLRPPAFCPFHNTPHPSPFPHRVHSTLPHIHIRLLKKERRFEGEWKKRSGTFDGFLKSHKTTQHFSKDEWVLHLECNSRVIALNSHASPYLHVFLLQSFPLHPSQLHSFNSHRPKVIAQSGPTLPKESEWKARCRATGRSSQIIMFKTLFHSLHVLIVMIERELHEWIVCDRCAVFQSPFLMKTMVKSDHEHPLLYAPFLVLQNLSSVSVVFDFNASINDAAPVSPMSLAVDFK